MIPRNTPARGCERQKYDKGLAIPKASISFETAYRLIDFVYVSLFHAHILHDFSGFATSFFEEPKNFGGITFFCDMPIYLVPSSA